MAKVLGVDLSLTATGLAVVSDGRLVYSASIRSKPTGKKPKDEVGRMDNIVEDIEDCLAEQDIDLTVIEGVAFQARNTTALSQLSGLTYILRNYLYKQKRPFLVVAPSSLKKFITGKGNAQKDHVMLEIYKRYGITLLDNNIADAFGLAMIGSLFLKETKSIDTAQTQVIQLISSQI